MTGQDQKLSATVPSLLALQAAGAQNPQDPGEEEMPYQSGTLFLPQADLIWGQFYPTIKSISLLQSHGGWPWPEPWASYSKWLLRQHS